MYIVLLKENEGTTDIEKIKVKQEELDLPTLRDLVGCDWLQTVLIKEDVLLVFDEEYLLTHSRTVPNYLPSIMYGAAKHGNPICGNVVVCKLKDDKMLAVKEDACDFMVKQLNDMQDKCLKLNVKI